MKLSMLYLVMTVDADYISISN